MSKYSEQDAIKKAFEREKAKVQELENILEDRTRDLFLANRDIKKQNEILEEKVLERTQDLELMNRELLTQKRSAEKANLIKSEFLANMSHEIRTPMHNLLALTHLLTQTDLSQVQQKYLRKIKLSGEVLLAIVNDVLDFSKIEAGEMLLEKTPFDVLEVFRETLEIFSEEAHSKNVKLKLLTGLDGNKYIRSDPLRLRQILLNLISNALKFTDSGSIEVSFSFKKISEKYILDVSVKDTGIGVPKESIDSIFNEFTQAEATTSRKHGGSGLGLAICKKLVKLFNGEIFVESKFGQGSIFNFYIEVEEVSLKEVEILRSSSVDSSPIIQEKNILVVDDHQGNLEVIKLLLESLKHNVDVVSSAKRALEVLENRSYDLIFMDCQMPIMDGFECSMKIRNDLQLKIPIIALTASAMHSDRKKCEESGMNDYMTKPVTVKLLQKAILRWSFFSP